MWRNRLGIVLACACCAGLLAAPALAEKADRSKPINVESERMHVDDATKTSVFQGNVVITQGTLTIHADKVTIHQDKDGFQYATAIGNPATFREKRDGGQGYIDGAADRIEYDGKADRVQFFNHAWLKREPADEVHGNYISYDGPTEYFTVTPGANAGPDARVHAVIQPRAAAEKEGKGPAPDAHKQKPQ
jgi:lipopolysaccharide export system protein LptA